jgi:hypothetical protein
MGKISPAPSTRADRRRGKGFRFLIDSRKSYSRCKQHDSRYPFYADHSLSEVGNIRPCTKAQSCLGAGTTAMTTPTATGQCAACCLCCATLSTLGAIVGQLPRHRRQSGNILTCYSYSLWWETNACIVAEVGGSRGVAGASLATLHRRALALDLKNPRNSQNGAL